MSPTTTTTTGAAEAIREYFTQVRQQLEQIRNDTMAEAADAMADALQKGEDAAHQRIETAETETGRERSGDVDKRDPGRTRIADPKDLAGHGEPGRIDTGAYFDEFQHDYYQVNKDHMQGRFGWIGEDTAPQAHSAGGKSYFELQEKGFTTRGGHEVEDVHALLNASEVAKAEFKKRLTDYVRGGLK